MEKNLFLGLETVSKRLDACLFSRDTFVLMTLDHYASPDTALITTHTASPSEYRATVASAHRFTLRK